MIIPIENSHGYHSIPRNKDLKYEISNDCNHPSKSLVIDWKGECFVCPCEIWLPISVGNIDQFTKLEEIWMSPVAQKLQKDIMKDKKFTHCAVDRCGIMIRDYHQAVHQVSINIDESCNLRCPSCRTDNIMITEGPDFDIKLKRANHIVDMLEEFDQPCHIIMTGNGDPLASAIMRPLIHRWRPKPNHTLRLFTNGLLLKKQLDGNPIMDHITEFMISIDAGSQDVYERVRLGGSWTQLITNFNWLKQQIRKKYKKVMLQFVIQKENYRDLENFCRLVVSYGFIASVTYLENWATWPDFEEQDVIGNSSHPLHSEAVALLSQAIEKYQDKDITFGAKLRQVVDWTENWTED